MGIGEFNLQYFILRMAVLVIAITIHEFAHAITADRLGDPTPRRQGRISLLPPDHLDPIGTILMVLSSITGFGIGWGKPVMTQPDNFRKPRRDSGIVAIAGPISNILQAIVFALIFRFIGLDNMDTPLGMFIYLGIRINLGLAFFNMLPIGPLDGHWIIQSVLPHEQALRYRDWNMMYGGMIFIGLVLLGGQALSAILSPPINNMTVFLLKYVSGLG